MESKSKQGLAAKRGLKGKTRAVCRPCRFVPIRSTGPTFCPNCGAPTVITTVYNFGVPPQGS